jgi:hypothetical protein
MSIVVIAELVAASLFMAIVVLFDIWLNTRLFDEKGEFVQANRNDEGPGLIPSLFVPSNNFFGAASTWAKS